METPDNLTQLSTPRGPNSTTISLDTMSQPKKWSLLLIILILLVLVFASISGYLYLESHSLRAQLTSSPTITPSSSPQPSLDPTATWRTYTNQQYGISIMFPSDWQFEESQTPKDEKWLSRNLGQVLSPGANISHGEISKGYYLTISANKPTPNYTTLKEYIDFSTDQYKYQYTSKIVNNVNGYLFAQNNTNAGFLFEKGGLFFVINWITDQDSNLLDQILSTFQFLDEKDSSSNSSTGYKYSNTVVAFEPPLSNSDYSDIRAELTTAVVEPFIDFHDAAYGKGSVVSLLISSSDTPNFPYKLIGIGKSGGQTYELLNKDDDGFWWIPTCMGKCPVSDSIRHKYVDIYKFVE